MAEQEQEIDLEALEASINQTITDEPEEVIEDAEEVEEVVEEAVEAKPNIDELLNSDTPVALSNIFSDEEITEEAVKRGYNADSSDKFGHKISAVEFLERAPLFNKINLMRGDVDELKKQNQKIIEQNKKIAQAKIDSDKKHVEELKAQKDQLLNKDFLDADDIQEVRALDKQIEDTPVTETEEGENELYTQFKEAKSNFESENKEWYGANRTMTLLADDESTKYVETYHAKHGVPPDPTDLFNHVMDEVKKEFPTLGKEVRQTRVASTNNRTVATTTRAPKKTLDDLPEETRAIAREVMEASGLSEQEYLSTYEI